MNSHRYQYLFEMLDKFELNLKPSTRVLLWSTQLLIIATLLLFQLKFLFN